jgi:hypothetical protein
MQRPQEKTTPKSKEEGGFTVQHWVGIGVAGAGLITGAIALAFVLDYLPTRASLDRSIKASKCNVPGKTELACPPDATPAQREEASQLTDQNNTIENDIRVRGFTLGAVGGALVVGGVVVFLLAPRSPFNAGPTKTGILTDVHVVPHVGTREQGIEVSATF